MESDAVEMLWENFIEAKHYSDGKIREVGKYTLGQPSGRQASGYILKQSTLRLPLLIYNSWVLFALKAREPPRLNPVKLRCQVKRGLLLVIWSRICIFPGSQVQFESRICARLVNSFLLISNAQRVKPKYRLIVHHRKPH